MKLSAALIVAVSSVVSIAAAAEAEPPKAGKVQILNPPTSSQA